jgi:hypothetical protein
MATNIVVEVRFLTSDGGGWNLKANQGTLN